jgi:hypothetical protein
VREASGVRVGTGVSGGRVARSWYVCTGVGVHVGGKVALGVGMGATVLNCASAMGGQGFSGRVGTRKIIT